MTDRDQQQTSTTPDPTRADARDPDSLRLDDGPLKQEGDALRDGSGSRQGQSPPNVGPTESR